MASVFGKVDEFDGSKEEWTQYVEHVNHFFEANDITDDGKKRAILLSVIGSSKYALLRNLVSPAKPGENRTTNWCLFSRTTTTPLLPKRFSDLDSTVASGSQANLLLRTFVSSVLWQSFVTMVNHWTR